MRFYIASKLENAAAVSRLASALKAAGHEHTYDWTPHGSIKAEGRERLNEVGEMELAGVLTADVIIVLLPGGRGTHIEIGIALGAGKKIILCAKDDAFFNYDENTTSFYWCNGVTQCVGSEEDWMAAIIPKSL